jgi:thioredoxin-like negative regulator of GroEL
MRSRILLALATTFFCGAASAEPLIGPGVGSSDLLVAEGMRLYNEKAYEPARDRFLKATRASPATLPTYLSLARASFALEDLELSCQVYKVYVRAAPASPDRDKAQSELDLCERRLARVKDRRELSKSYVGLKASFFEALEKGSLMGPGSAAEQLRALVEASYAAPDLGEMAGKLAHAAEASADKTFEASLSRRQQAKPSELREAAGLYQLALDFGAEPGTHASRIAFLEGMALMVEGKAAEAGPRFAEAAAKDPSNREAIFLGGLSRYLSGDKAGAIDALKKGLPEDPRTAVLELSASFDRGPSAAASELERLLFARRFQQ